MVSPGCERILEGARVPFSALFSAFEGCGEADSGGVGRGLSERGGSRGGSEGYTYIYIYICIALYIYI